MHRLRWKWRAVMREKIIMLLAIVADLVLIINAWHHW